MRSRTPRSVYRDLRLLAHFAPLLLIALAVAPARAEWSTDPSLNTRMPLEWFDPTDTRDNWPIGACPDSAGGAIVLSKLYYSAMSGSYFYVQRMDAFGQPRWGTSRMLPGTDYAFQTLSAPVSDGSGGAYVGYGSTYRVRLFHVTDSGVSYLDVTAAGVDLVNPPNPVVASDGAGGAVIVWWQITAGGVGWWGQRVSSAGVPMWPAGGVRLNTTNSGSRPLCLVGDGTGGVLLFTGGTDITLFSINGAGVRRTPGAGAVVCNAAGTQAPPSHDSMILGDVQWAVSDGAGGAIAVWNDTRTDATGDLYAQRVDTLGNVAWSPNGVPVCTRTGPALEMRIASDGAGGVVVAWQDSTHVLGAGTDVYAQRIDAGGVARWAADGIPVCDVAGDQRYAAITSRGAGGAIVAWEDPRDAATAAKNVYAQALDGDGNRLWDPLGIAVSTAVRDQTIPYLVPVGDHAAIACWQDYRGYEPGNGFPITGFAQYLPLDEAPLLGVEPPPSLAPLARLRVAPNPALAAARVSFSRDASAHASLELLDVAGRVVRTRDLSALAPGAREVTFDDLGALPPGLYLVRVKQDERADHARLMLMH